MRLGDNMIDKTMGKICINGEKITCEEELSMCEESDCYMCKILLPYGIISHS